MICKALAVDGFRPEAEDHSSTVRERLTSKTLYCNKMNNKRVTRKPSRSLQDTMTYGRYPKDADLFRSPVETFAK